ncbi:MAG TPA: Gldg family protein [Verrucomicrobiae bacterium]|nr:Gldg family protein [Verrucomicrobiae bacterium]
MQKKTVETILYSTIGVLVMAAILVAVNVITGAVRARVDLTKEKAYTLSEGTRQILSKLDTPVRIRFYCTQTDAATPYTVMLNSHARKVEDLLAEYRQVSKGKLIIEKFNPEPDSDAEDSARLDGLEEQPLPGGDRFYLGLAVSQLDAKEAIPFLSPERERQLEYDISRAITRVVTPEKPVVGVMSGLPVFGAPANPMMMQMGQRGQEPWAIISELQNDFTVRNVAVDVEIIEDDVDVLFLIHPKGISEQAQFAIDQFVLRGGRLVAFLDSQSLVDSQNQNPMMRQMPGAGSSLERLLAGWGLQYDTAKVVADRTYNMELGEAGDRTQRRPAWLTLASEAINPEDLATATLDSVWYFSGGAFTGTPAAGLKQSVLLKSSKDAQLVDGMMSNFGAEGILRDFKPAGVEYALAVRLTGKFKTAFPNGKPSDQDAGNSDTNAVATSDTALKEGKRETSVVLIGDADMINDGFSIRRMNTPFGQMAAPLNGNLNFALNLVEQLSGDSNLIAVRSRTVMNRPFTRVKAMQKDAEERYMAEIRNLQESQQQTVARLNELQQHKDSSQRFRMSPEQQAEIENLRKKEGEIGKKLRQVEKDLKREVTALQRRIQWYNILTIPIAVGLVGIALAVFKHKRTSAK